MSASTCRSFSGRQPPHLVDEGVQIRGRHPPLDSGRRHGHKKAARADVPSHPARRTCIRRPSVARRRRLPGSAPPASKVWSCRRRSARSRTSSSTSSRPWDDASARVTAAMAPPDLFHTRRVRERWPAKGPGRNSRSTRVTERPGARRPIQAVQGDLRTGAASPRAVFMDSSLEPKGVSHDSRTQGLRNSCVRAAGCGLRRVARGRRSR
jgi:hypothetical protein